MNDEKSTHPLVRMAAGHHQFESIHPFADGNGRTGRPINLLYLTEQKLANLPVLCSSRCILRNRPAYYRLLDSTRRTGNWEPWILWILDGMQNTAEWVARTLDRQAAITEQTIPRYRDAKPRSSISDESIRFVSSRLYCRSTDLREARLATKAAVALAMLRQIAGAAIFEEQPGHRPALFVNAELIELWTGE